ATPGCMRRRSNEPAPTACPSHSRSYDPLCGGGIVFWRKHFCRDGRRVSMVKRGLIVANIKPGSEERVAPIFAESDASELPRLAGSRRARLSRPLLLSLLTMLLYVVGTGIILPIAPFYATAFGADALQVGLLFTTYSAAQFLTIPVLGAISDRWGRRPVLLLS